MNNQTACAAMEEIIPPEPIRKMMMNMAEKTTVHHETKLYETKGERKSANCPYQNVRQRRTSMARSPSHSAA